MAAAVKCVPCAGLQLEAAAHSSIQHSVSICFLAPGIYSLYTYDVHQLDDHTAEDLHQQAVNASSTEGITAVCPAYFIVQ